MIPCSFNELGKKCRDLFEKNIPLGKVSLRHKTSDPAGVDIEVNGVLDTNAQAINGSFEFVRVGKDYSVSQKITTATVFTSGVTIHDKFLNGLKSILEVSYVPVHGKVIGTLSSEYKHPHVNCKVDMEFPGLAPIVTSSLVLACDENRGYLAGVQATVDTMSMILKRWRYALGVDRGWLMANLGLRNHEEVSVSLYQRFSSSLEAGVAAEYSHNLRSFSLGVVSCYKFDNCSWVKTRVNTDRMMAVAYGFTLESGVKFSMATEVDVKNLNTTQPRVGISIEYGT